MDIWRTEKRREEKEKKEKQSRKGIEAAVIDGAVAQISAS